MKPAWTSEALQDRFNVWETIAADNLDAAIHLDEQFDDAARLLARQPALGRKGRVPGTREWVVHENYCLIYEVADDRLLILALVHARRCWPP
jgi:plasmid stabilization system protein ParE